MHLLGVALGRSEQSVALMLGAALALYVAGRAAADAAAAGRPASAGRLAVGHWLPVAAVTVVAAATGQFAVAVGIVFATAVASLSLGMGILAAVAPAKVASPPAARRTWPLLVPAALLGLLAGFHRDVRWVDVIALSVEGLFVLTLWAERPVADGPVADPVVVPAVVPGRVPAVLRPFQMLLALALAVVGAYLATLGVTGAGAANEMASPGLLTATFLAPLVVLPILGTVADLSHRGPAAGSEAASALVGVALLDACAGLPLAVAAAAGRVWLVGTLSADPSILGRWPNWPQWLGVTASTAAVVGSPVAATTKPDLAAAVPGIVGDVSAVVPFPLAVWRVDVVVLIALAAALVPVGLGRWPLTRAQGVLLIVAYLAYLFMSLRVGVANV